MSINCTRDVQQYIHQQLHMQGNAIEVDHHTHLVQMHVNDVHINNVVAYGGSGVKMFNFDSDYQNRHDHLHSLDGQSFMGRTPKHINECKDNFTMFPNTHYVCGFKLTKGNPIADNIGKSLVKGHK